MNLINRAKNILLTPKTEWNVVATESATLSSLLTSYVIPLALIPAIASLLNGLMWNSLLGFGRSAIIGAIIAFVSAVLSYIITAYAADLLASNFKSEKNINTSAQLSAFSLTASYVASILSIIPILGWLGSIAGWVYAVYLMYLGVGPVKKTPEDQKIVYVIVIIVIQIVAYFIIASILSAIFLAGSITSGMFR